MFGFASGVTKVVPKWRLVAAFHRLCISYLEWPKQIQHALITILKMQVNTVSMIFGLGSWAI